MSLDQTLTEIEPILRCTDDTFQFTHPSFQEILTAKQFAEEIMSGKLSLADAYWIFWREEPGIGEIIDEPDDYFPNGTWPIQLEWYSVVNRVAEIFSQNNHHVDIVLETYGIVDEYGGKYVTAGGLISFKFL